MDSINIKGLTLRATHGVLHHEQSVPQTFIIDVTVYLSLRQAGSSDSLENSVSYADICDMVERIVSDNKFSLIERLAYVISESILEKYRQVEAVETTVHKPQAPLNQLVSDVSVSVKKQRD